MQRSRPAVLRLRHSPRRHELLKRPLDQNPIGGLGVAAVSLYFVRYFRADREHHAALPLDAMADGRGATLRWRGSF